MIVDCDTCTARGPACKDCVVSVLLGPVPSKGWQPQERRALDVLAAAGMVPRLRMVAGAGERTVPDRCAGA